MDLVQATATPNLIRNVFIADSSASTGAGKTGLVPTSFKAYYKRNRGASSASIALISLRILLGSIRVEQSTRSIR